MSAALVRWIPLQAKKTFTHLHLAFTMHKHLKTISLELTFVIKNSFLKEKADLISTGDEVVSTSLQVRKFKSVTWSAREW